MRCFLNYSLRPSLKTFLVLPVFEKREAQTLNAIRYTTYLELEFSDLIDILKVSLFGIGNTEQTRSFKLLLLLKLAVEFIEFILKANYRV